MATLNMAKSRVRPWIISRALIAHTCFGRNGGLAPVSLPLFQGVRIRAVKRQLSLSVMILLLGYGAVEHAFPQRWTCRIMSAFRGLRSSGLSRTESSRTSQDVHLCPQSGGEFNRSVQHQLQSIGRGFEGQGLSRALIEPQSNGVEVGLGEAREIGSSREVLSQQPVGVLVAATLPWTARITEVNLHVGGNREAFVARHLLALVPRQGAS